MTTAPVQVSVGVCAFNEEDRISALLSSVLSQDLPFGVDLLELIVVSSGSTDATDSIVESHAARDHRVRLVREPSRAGKASALNRILEAYRGELLVLANGDALLNPGCLNALLRPFVREAQVVLACGRPVPESGQGRLQTAVQEFLWAIHNRTLHTLSDLGAANHCCDELLAMRRGFVEFLPDALINDGAYLGAFAALHGQSVRFCSNATVVVRTPRTLFGLLQQRRRILRGHRQMSALLPHPANTLRSLIRERPELAASILLQDFAERPHDLPVFLLLALPLETAASLLAFSDALRGTRYSPTWPMVDRL